MGLLGIPIYTQPLTVTVFYQKLPCTGFGLACNIKPLEMNSVKPSNKKV